jgi:hypothetical protein
VRFRAVRDCVADGERMKGTPVPRWHWHSEVAVCAQCRRAFSKDKRTKVRFCSIGCRFWAQVEFADDQDACWPWMGKLNAGGYGVQRRKEGSRMAHRQAWEYTFGEAVPDGLFVLHRCDNRRCCNPRHHFLGTKADNNHDMYAKGRDCHSKGTSFHQTGRAA